MNQGPSLAATLRRFNRKERYWVVRTALGGASEQLDARFCSALEGALADRDVQIGAEHAWWAVDYHLDWLLAALRMHCEGSNNVIGRAWDNATGAVQGNQEDIDLVIAAGSDLILVEAKNGAWSRKQLRSKLERLRLLNADENGILGEGTRRVRMHLVLMSPSAPNAGKLDPLLKEAPAWMHTGVSPSWRWVKLQVDEPAPDSKVHRADAEGNKDKLGSYWAVAVTQNAG